MNRIPSDRPASALATNSAADQNPTQSTNAPGISNIVTPALTAAVAAAEQPANIGRQHQLHAQWQSLQAAAATHVGGRQARYSTLGQPPFDADINEALGNIPFALDLPSPPPSLRRMNPLLHRPPANANEMDVAPSSPQFDRNALGRRINRSISPLPALRLPDGTLFSDVEHHIQRNFPIPDSLQRSLNFQDDVQEAPAIADVIAPWIDNNNAGSHSALMTRWQEIAHEDGAEAFSTFLIRLRETVNADNPHVRQTAMELVKQLSDDPVLRQQIFAISVGATESCEDRVSHTLLMMVAAARAANFSQTHFDYDHQAISVQRQFHRLALLHTLAEEIVGETGNGKEHIETDHYLKVNHADALHLSGLVPTMAMRWATFAKVTPARDDTVVPTIKRQENAEFAQWLAHSPSWLGYVHTQVPPLFDASREKLAEALDQPFQARLDEQLRATGLNKTTDSAAWNDAERILGKTISDQIVDQFNQKLTHDFLDLRGARHLLQPHWPVEECVAKNPLPK